MEEILYVFLFTFFFRCRSFSTWRQLAFPLFLTAVTKLLRFSSNKIGLLWFLSLALALSLLSTLMYTLKLSGKKESAFVAVGFISKRPGSYAIYWRNARVLEMQNFILAYMRGVDVRTDDFFRTKISWMRRLPIFFTHGGPLSAPHARDSSAINFTPRKRSDVVKKATASRQVPAPRRENYDMRSRQF